MEVDIGPEAEVEVTIDQLSPLDYFKSRMLFSYIFMAEKNRKHPIREKTTDKSQQNIIFEN